MNSAPSFDDQENNGGHSGAPANTDEGSVFLAVVDDGPRIAFAAYVEDKNVIFIEDTQANGFQAPELVERVLASVRPTLLLVPNKIASNASFLQILTTRPVDSTTDDVHNTNCQRNDTDRITGTGEFFTSSNSIPYRILKSKTLDVRACKAEIKQLRVKSMIRNQTSSGSHPARHFPLDSSRSSNRSCGPLPNLWLASIIDFDSTVLLQAIGALVNFLQSTIFQHEHQSLLLNDIRPLHCQMFVHVPNDTLTALHIVATEHHPLAAARGRGNAKEGVSLFSLMDRTRTRDGHERLREWILRPLCDLEAIYLRQDGVQLMAADHSECSGAVEKIGRLLGLIGSTSVTRLMSRMLKSSCLAKDFVSLPRCLSLALEIYETLSNEFELYLERRIGMAQTRTANTAGIAEQNQLVQYLKFVKHILDRCNYQVIYSMLEQITSIVDEEATLAGNDISIRRGFNPLLDSYKHQYANLKGVLDEAKDRICDRLKSVHSLRESLRVVFLPQFGFFVVLSHDIDNRLLPEDFQSLFDERENRYFKSAEMNELDATHGDYDSLIKDLEQEILVELEDDILQRDTEIRETFDALADLDCIMSLAEIAVENGYIRPIVMPAHMNCIRIKNGRHPLQEHLVDQEFVKNDTGIDQDSRVNIITGPNFSGKSCYARQVGILAYMAHIGSFIPCESAEISLIDRILCQFSAIETCEVPQSSFQHDLTRVGRMLRTATPSSLLLMDEFGKGTSPASGIALLSSALDTMSEIGCKVVCTTHFIEVFSMNLLKDGENGIKAYQMAVQFPETDDEEALPLFKLQDGVAASSAGLICAKVSGVKQAVIDRAGEIVSAMKEGEQVQPLPEVLYGELFESTFSLLWALRETDWNQASEEYIHGFLDAALDCT